MDYKRSMFVAVMGVLIMLIGAVVPALGQGTPEPQMLAEYGSQYIRVRFGDDVSLTDSSYLRGSNLILTQKGDPETVGDDDRAIAICYWKIKVGDVVRVIGDTSNGSWTKLPTAYPQPPSGLGLGKTGGFIQGDWAAKVSENLTVNAHVRASTVRDQVRFEVTLSHTGTTAQSIGVQYDAYLINANSRTIGYPWLPGKGINRVGVYPERATGMLLKGSDIPSYLEIFDDMEKPATVIRGTFGLADATMPDWLAIADHYQDLFGIENWIPTDYAPDPMRVIDDFEYALAWNPVSVASGASRRIITYTGVGAASASWTNTVNKKVEQDYAVLAVQGPRVLKYDSTLPATQNSLDPQPFTVSAYVNVLNTDAGDYAMKNATATLYLPQGLELEPEMGNTPTKVVGAVPSNSESAPVTWKVRATGQYSGELQYSVSASDTSGWQQTVSRKIVVPATKKSVLRYGWQLVHVPFQFSNPAVDHVLGMQWGTFGASYWDPIVSSVSNSYVPVTQTEPGKAFWLRVAGIAEWNDVDALQLASDARITGEVMGKQDETQYVRIEPGWNMIGNPLVYPVYWGQVLVQRGTGGATVTLDQAVSNDWLSKTLFAWNPDKWLYDVIKEDDALLNPWKGYWVRAKQSCILVFRPPVYPGGDVTASIGGY